MFNKDANLGEDWSVELIGSQEVPQLKPKENELNVKKHVLENSNS